MIQQPPGRIINLRRNEGLEQYMVNKGQELQTISIQYKTKFL